MAAAGCDPGEMLPIPLLFAGAGQKEKRKSRPRLQAGLSPPRISRSLLYGEAGRCSHGGSIAASAGRHLDDIGAHRIFALNLVAGRGHSAASGGCAKRHLKTICFGDGDVDIASGYR